jgi:hypothetical protein
VVVTGSPQVALTINSLTRQAVYASGSGTTALTFNYPVVLADTGAVTCAATTVALNSGTIKDTLAVSATLTFSAPTLVAVAANDAVAAVASAVLTSSGTLPALVTGNTFVVTLNYSKAVTVTGTPQIKVQAKSKTRQAAYASGSGTSALVFSYTVQSTDSATSDQIATDTTVALNSGTMVDALGIPVNLTFSAPNTLAVSFN